MTDDQKNNPQPEGQPVPVEESPASAPAVEEPIPGESQQATPAEEAVPVEESTASVPAVEEPIPEESQQAAPAGEAAPVEGKARAALPLWRSPSQGRASRPPLSQGPRREGSPTRPSLGRGGITARRPRLLTPRRLPRVGTTPIPRAGTSPSRASPGTASPPGSRPSRPGRKCPGG